MQSLRNYDQAVLLVDDEADILSLARLTLEGEGVRNIVTLTDSRQALQAIARHRVGVVILDLMMPELSGADLLQSIIAEYPDLPVIIMTALGDAETAVASLKSGAFDYLVKPVDPNRLISVVEKAVRMHSLQREVSSLKEYLLSGRLEHADAFADYVTCSAKMRAIFQYAELVARSRQPILITGETGVGKELMALSIHRLSKLSGAFVPVNIAGLDDPMFSDTLFGHTKGAFTGANHSRDGLITKASGGTLFLDEIGDLSPLSQVKMLRLLQEKEYYALGSDMLKASDARIIVATNQDLKQLMAEGKFRKDLYYRLCSYHIHIPPLRERSEDIPLLTHHFVLEATSGLDIPVPALDPELLTALAVQAFPGNVRELRAMVHDALFRQRDGKITIESFPGISYGRRERALYAISPTVAGEEHLLAIFGRFPTLEEMESYMIGRALQAVNGKRGEAATLLGISRQALHRKLKEE